MEHIKFSEYNAWCGGDTFTYRGRSFRIRLERDDDYSAPWDEHDGHGTVSEWTTRDKMPGELVLNSDRHSKRYYDFAEACRIARRDGWGFLPGQLQTAQSNTGEWRAWCKRKAWDRGDTFETVAADINEAIRGVYQKHRASMTPRQYAAGAAMADYDRLRAWCADEWFWCGVIVEHLDEEGETTGLVESCWGIESDAGDYLADVAAELAYQICIGLERDDEVTAAALAESLMQSRPDMYRSA